VVPEARLEETGHGLVPLGEGWFVVNAKDAPWHETEGRSAVCFFEGDVGFDRLGINISVLEPGGAMAMYHWEADQEDFLVVSGEALLIVEGETRPLKAWDFFHCPPGTKHAIVGAGDRRCVVVAVGARAHRGTESWGVYVPEEAARPYGASVDSETKDVEKAYAGAPPRLVMRRRDGWL
jgi:uncharacterized cupin superfamily protein